MSESSEALSSSAASPASLPGRLRTALARVARWPARVWRRLRAWRRIYFTRGGLFFVAGAFGVGFAAMNTGNNLLFLILGGMLGSIVLSSWLSEQSIRDIEVRRMIPRAVTVGEPASLRYEVHNHKRWLPSLAVELREEGLPTSAFLPRLDGGSTEVVRSEHRFVRRGVYPLSVVTVSTSFPFGLFRKERDVTLPGELVVWPRSDRDVPAVAVQGREGFRTMAGQRGSAGTRGEYRGLRSYRPGDDPRDIHWRSTARLGEPVIREYEEDASEGVWICLDTRGQDEDLIEETVEIAASLAARFQGSGRRLALSTPDVELEPADGHGQLERILDALARVEFDPAAPPVSPPVAPRRCVLVSVTGRGGDRFGDVVRPDGRGFGPGRTA